MLKEQIYLQHGIAIGENGEPLYAQINRDLKTKRLHAMGMAATGHTMSGQSNHYDLDSKIIYQNQNIHLDRHGLQRNYEEFTDAAKLISENRTDSAKLNTSGDSNDIYHFNNNNNSTANATKQNQWV